MTITQKDIRTLEELKKWPDLGVVGGFLPNLDIEAYHNPECPGISNSSIGKVANENGTLADLYEYRQRGPESKDWGDYGNAVHTALLQPELFSEKYTALPEFFRVSEKDGTTRKVKSNFALKEGKQLKEKAELEGKTILRYEEYLGVIRSVENVKKHRYAKDFVFGGEGVVEGSCFWIDSATGMLCKTRPDRLCREYIVEIKTTQDGSPKYFSRHLYDFGYHRQGAFQLDGVRAAMGVNPQYFVVVAIEKTAPFKVSTHVVNARAIAKGRDEYLRALAEIKTAEQTNEWPGYKEELHALDLPEWAYTQELK